MNKINHNDIKVNFSEMCHPNPGIKKKYNVNINLEIKCRKEKEKKKIKKVKYMSTIEKKLILDKAYDAEQVFDWNVDFKSTKEFSEQNELGSKIFKQLDSNANAGQDFNSQGELYGWYNLGAQADATWGSLLNALAENKTTVDVGSKSDANYNQWIYGDLSELNETINNSEGVMIFTVDESHKVNKSHYPWFPPHSGPTQTSDEVTLDSSLQHSASIQNTQSNTQTEGKDTTINTNLETESGASSNTNIKIDNSTNFQNTIQTEENAQSGYKSNMSANANWNLQLNDMLKYEGVWYNINNILIKLDYRTWFKSVSTYRVSLKSQFISDILVQYNLDQSYEQKNLTFLVKTTPTFSRSSC